jgi:thiol:disulfide interchange protein DsbD
MKNAPLPTHDRRAEPWRAPNCGPLCAGVIAAFGVLAGSSSADAKPFWMRGTDSNEQDFLPPDVAFRLAAHVSGQRLELRWAIADGYYVYRDKIEVSAASPGIVVGPPDLPAGTALTDEYFGAQQVYFTAVLVTVPLERSDYGAHPPQIKITYQGCAKAGLCYPPISQVIFPDALSPPSDRALRPAQADSQGPRGFPAWPMLPILGGMAAFVLAGLLLRKNRRLAVPTP